MLGAILGDICGSVYEFSPVQNNNSPLITSDSNFTDDTVLTIAVADAFLNHKDLTSTIQKYARKYEGRGYGGKFYDWIYDNNPKPYGSYGNGSAMRVSSIGWLANSIDEVLELAQKSAEVTHNHIEGINGAQAVALAIYLARNGSSKNDIKEEIEKRFYYNLSRKLEDIIPNYKFNETCQESVPQAITAFLESTDFSSAIRNAILLRGDADTQAAIAGSIAEAFYKEIPSFMKELIYELLPNDFLQIIEQFQNRLKSKKIISRSNHVINFELKKANLILEKADFIVNASNTELLLGSGVSNAFYEHCGKNTFQEELNSIRKTYDEINQGDVIPSSSGSAINFKYALHVIVMNYKPNSILTDPNYKHIEKALYNILTIVKNYSNKNCIKNPKIVIPLLGCGVGGLDKKRVLEQIKEILCNANFDLQVVVCIYDNYDYEQIKNLI